MQRGRHPPPICSAHSGPPVTIWDRCDSGKIFCPPKAGRRLCIAHRHHVLVWPVDCCFAAQLEAARVPELVVGLESQRERRGRDVTATSANTWHAKARPKKRKSVQPQAEGIYHRMSSTWKQQFLVWSHVHRESTAPTPFSPPAF